nr:methyltransferase and helicase [Fusarium asiaticum vivivirus 1]
MAGRIPQLSFDMRGSSMDMEADGLLTEEMVDEAVEVVLEPHPEDVREDYRNVWASDDTSEVARMLQASMASKTSRLRSFADVSRKQITVPYLLDADKQRALNSRYRELDIRYLPHNLRDHMEAAADRLLSTVILHSRVPENVPYVDFGGSVVMHVEQGNSNVLVVGGLHDPKDAARAQMNMMRLRVLANDEKAKPITRQMARSILNDEGLYYREGSLQDYDGDRRVGVMSHVYDVPLVEIPAMMEKTGMLLFEGTLHFSSRFFFEESGELEDVGARFELKDGEFSMGFVDSPSHWYSHDWAQFSLYGTDQLINVGDNCYSYKIYENRGDTISFRILRVSSNCRRPRKQYVARPGVPMIEVSSYEHASLVAMESGTLSKVKRRYPKDVWERMVRSAMNDAARSELNFQNQVKAYRNIVAGHKYNGVSTISEKVPATDVHWLVVDSSLYALTRLVLMRRSTRIFTANEMERRALAGCSVFGLMAKALLKPISDAIGATLSPLKTFMDWLVDAFTEDKLVEAAVMPRLVRVDVGRELHAEMEMGGNVASVPHDEYPFREFTAKLIELDAFVEKVLEEAREVESAAVVSNRPEVRVEGKLFDEDLGDFATELGVSEGETLVDKPEWVPFSADDPVVKEVYSYSTDSHTEAQMKEAMYETIRAIKEESNALESWCANVFSKFAGGRGVDASEVSRVKEQYNDFDFWYVTDGVIANESVTGVKGSSFAYSGVYCPQYVTVEDPNGEETYTRLVPVLESEYSDEARGIFRVYNTMSCSYTGLIMVCNGLKVLNGPHIAAGIQVASKMPCNAVMGGLVGGPGCGKTHTIGKSFKKGDMAITPLRSSARDIRLKLQKEKGFSERAAHKCVRTLDSLLVEAGQNAGFSGSKKLPSAFMVHVDESYNTNAGRIYSVLSLLNAKRCMMYGDKMQIEFVVRADMVLTYAAVKYSHVVMRYTIFRFGARILACVNPHYGGTLRTANACDGEVSMTKVMPAIDASEDVKLLVMNQAAKNILFKKYPQFRSKISTVHEAQGSESDVVYLFNFEPRKMSADNPAYLYNQPRYVNVAITRARKRFTYVYTSDHPDLVKQWLKRAEDDSYVQACKDLQTAGESI